MLVHDADVADPFLLRVGDRWFAYATNSPRHNVQVFSSTDLVRWELLGDALPELPAWSRPGGTWSPSVLARGDQFVLYVVLPVPSYDRQSIAVAVSDRPEGPFRPDQSGPLVFQRGHGGSIDPDPFVDVDGSAWLLWKSDGERVGEPAALWIRQLSDDGRKLRGWRATRLLRTDADWEQPLLEAPCLWRAGPEHYVLFYSAGRWMTSGYGIGYATASSPRGPFTKVTTHAPWHGADDQVAGPGGQSVVRDEAGDAYLAYHGWSPDRVGYEGGGARRLHVDRLELDGAGHPLRRTDWSTRGGSR